MVPMDAKVPFRMVVEDGPVCTECWSRIWNQSQKFCGRCGDPLHNQCPNCKCQVLKMDIFCTACGGKCRDIPSGQRNWAPAALLSTILVGSSLAYALLKNRR